MPGSRLAALIASLQYLPPRQRAVLVLRDVLAFPAAEVAAMLGIRRITGAVSDSFPGPGGSSRV